MTPTNRTDEVSVSKTPRKHIVGDGCKCGAYGAYECGCDGVDWRSSREVELEAEVAEVCSVARSLRDKNDKLHTHNADLEVEIGKWVNLIKQIGFKVKCLYSNFPDDNGHILSKIDEQVAIASAITSAVAEERERAAKMVETFRPSKWWESLQYDVLDVLATELRQTPTQEGV